MSRKGRAALYALAVAVLAGVFALYSRPQIMVAVGDMIWACFGR
jgi:hypothetical protein